jgi:hypothetical protein
MHNYSIFMGSTLNCALLMMIKWFIDEKWIDFVEIQFQLNENLNDIACNLNSIEFELDWIEFKHIE